MTKLRVAVSPDVVSAGGAPIYDPSVLARLDHPRIEWSYLNEDVPVVTPEFTAEYDVRVMKLERAHFLATLKSLPGQLDEVKAAYKRRSESIL